MTDRIALSPLHHHQTPPDVSDDAAAGKTDQTGGAKQAAGTDAHSAALPETRDESGSSSLGAAALVKRHRAARRKMMGADVEAFAEQFAHTPIGKRFHFIRAELERHPELADTAIAVRLQGAPSHDREIVHAVLARTKATGFARYAIAERVLAKVRPLNADQREDAVNWVLNGKSVSDAVGFWQHQDVDFARTTALEQTLEKEQTALSVANIEVDIANANVQSAKMYALFHAVKPVSHDAELYTAATNLSSDFKGAEFNFFIAAGGSVLERSGAPLEAWATDPARQIQHVDGDVTGKIHEADRRYLQYASAHDAYVRESKQMQSALKGRAWETYTRASSKRDAAAKAMRHAAEAFKPAAQDALKSEGDFDIDMAAAGANILTSQLPDGVGSALEPLIANKVARAAVTKATNYVVKRNIKSAAREALKK
jgi:hypothetical protein